jgi:hypothetical protein
VSLSRSARTRLFAGDEGLANAIRSLSAAGLEVWALAGDPGWLEQPTQIPEPLQELIKIQEARALFHGLHLDVEPQADPRWRLGDGPRTQLLEALDPWPDGDRERRWPGLYAGRFSSRVP